MRRGPMDDDLLNYLLSRMLAHMDSQVRTKLHAQHAKRTSAAYPNLFKTILNKCGANAPNHCGNEPQPECI
jgi:hypothetical protein